MMMVGAGGVRIFREQSEAQTGAGPQRKDPAGVRTLQVSTFDPPKLKISLIHLLIINDL